MKGEPYICDECMRVFPERKKLNRHIKENHSLTAFSCLQCNQSFKRKEALDRHIRAVHLDKKFDCQYCGYKFIEKYKLKKHLKLRHSKLYCTTCETEIPKGADNLSHNCIVRLFSCDICDKVYQKESFLAKHKEEAHDVKAINLADIFPARDNTQLNTAIDPNAFKAENYRSCQLIKDKVIDAAMLPQKKRAKKFYICDFETCLQVFDRPYNLKVHKKTHEKISLPN